VGMIGGNCLAGISDGKEVDSFTALFMGATP
jgi:hypothetical protein